MTKKKSISVQEFGCLSPLRFFEHCIIKCPQGGRCRERGLLLALLSGKKVLDYSRRDKKQVGGAK